MIYKISGKLTIELSGRVEAATEDLARALILEELRDLIPKSSEVFMAGGELLTLALSITETTTNLQPNK
jgi:hypothetical protein